MQNTDKEIEIKLIYKDKNSVKNKLNELGAIFKEKRSVKDSYFSLNTTSMSNANDFVRIRQINDKDTELTFKGKCLEKNNVWERVELNVDIGSFKTMEKILLALKFNKIKDNETVREVWRFHNTEIIFMSFIKPQKLEIIEVEGPSTEAVEEVVNKLDNLVKKAGEEVFKSFD